MRDQLQIAWHSKLTRLSQYNIQVWIWAYHGYGPDNILPRRVFSKITIVSQSPFLPLPKGSEGITRKKMFSIYIAVGEFSCFFEVIEQTSCKAWSRSKTNITTLLDTITQSPCSLDDAMMHWLSHNWINKNKPINAWINAVVPGYNMRRPKVLTAKKLKQIADK